MSDGSNWFGYVELAAGALAVSSESAGAPPSENMRVTMRVGGARPDQGYRFLFSMQPDGSAQCEWELPSPPAAASAAPAPPRVGQATLATPPHLREAAMELARTASTQHMPMSPPRFTPGSLIGQLQIETPQGQVRTFFMADRAQAQNEKMPPPDEVQEVVDTIYKACEDAVGTTVRP
jgi:hypothetical protein